MKNPFITITDAETLTIEGNGANFWFESYHPGIFITNSKNISIKNLSIDYDPLPYTQGEIISIDPQGAHADIKLHPGFLPFESIRGWKDIKMFFYDQETTFLKKETSPLEVIPEQSIHLGDGMYRVYAKPDLQLETHLHAYGLPSDIKWGGKQIVIK